MHLKSTLKPKTYSLISIISHLLVKVLFLIALSERISLKLGCRFHYNINTVFLQPSLSSAGKNVTAASGLK